MYPGAWSQDHPDRTAVVMGGSGASLSYRQFEEATNRLAHLFREEGLVRTDHVAFFLPNGLELVVAIAAAERTGLYYTIVDAKLSAEEAAFIVGDCAARVVITSTALAASAMLPESCRAVERWWSVTEAPAPFEFLDERLEGRPATPVEDERLGASMVYSSGTTGRPKGVWRPLEDLHPTAVLPALNFASELYGLRDEAVVCVPGPMHHGMGHTPIGLVLRRGGTVVIMERFDATTLLEVVAAHRVTHIVMVPTMMSRMLDLADDVRAAHDLSSLEAVTLSGAPCPVSVKSRMIAWIGPIVREIYGSTEANGLCLVDSAEALERPGTVGRAVVGEPVILAEDGTPCPPGVVGSLWFRGATNFEYFGDAEKTAAGRDADTGLSSTGDIGYLDEEGYLFLTDREAFTIISGGVNIYPQEIENVLADHPAVADVAVLGVPHEDKGEEVKAVVALRAGHADDAALRASLLSACEQRLAKYKWPRSIDIVDEVPRTSTGKLDKHGLRRRYWPGDGLFRS
jgi:long-chain acyl-CoA synthetase